VIRDLWSPEGQPEPRRARLAQGDEFGVAEEAAGDAGEFDLGFDFGAEVHRGTGDNGGHGERGCGPGGRPPVVEGRTLKLELMILRTDPPRNPERHRRSSTDPQIPSTRSVTARPSQAFHDTAKCMIIS
jgi:hypothetical protein